MSQDSDIRRDRQIFQFIWSSHVIAFETILFYIIHFKQEKNKRHWCVM